VSDVEKYSDLLALLQFRWPGTRIEHATVVGDFLESNAAKELAKRDAEIERLRFEINKYAYERDLARRERDKAEADNARVRARVSELESYLHTCGPDCRKAGCVNARLRSTLTNLIVACERGGYLDAAMADARAALAGEGGT
jgi:hypothetical protein